MPSRSAPCLGLAVLLAAAATSSAMAQAVLRTHVSPTSQLNGYFGAALAAAGDVDADGTPDLLVGAFREANEVGRAHVFSGATGSLIHTLSLSAPEPLAYFGYSVAGPGDVDGDGRADLLVGAYGFSPGSAPVGAGRAYVYSGATGAVLLTLVSPNQQQSGGFGIAVAGLGDINDDGRPDFLIGSGDRTGDSPDYAGRAYLISGTDGATLHTLTSPNEEYFGGFGDAVAAIGDVDGDSVPDVVVGAPRENPGTSPEDTGRAYAFSGATGALMYTLVNPSEAVQGDFGRSLHGLGDVDDDGRPDFVAGTNRGRAYIFSGADGSLIHTLAIPGQVFTYLGFAVANAGDVDADGSDDALVGEYGWTREPFPTVPYAGRAHVFSGATGALLQTMTAPILQPEGHFGYAVAGMGDINGDARPELAVGAVQETADRRGRVYVYTDFSVGAEPSIPARATMRLVLAGPNPAESESRVRLTLMRPVPVRLAVYDVLGREQSVLSAGTLALGSYQFAIDVSGWAAGVYVVRAVSTVESPAVRLVVR